MPPIQRRPLLRVVMLLLMTYPSAGCHNGSPPQAQPDRREGAPTTSTSKPASQAGPSPRVSSYKLVGTVRKVDRASGVVTIRHEAIPGFMEAMTMPFDLKGQEVLEEIRPGDEVEGVLRVEREPDESGGLAVKDYHLLELAVTRPAPPESLRLNLSGGAPKLEPIRRPIAIGERVPDFSMTTQEGKTIRLSDLRGEVVVLTFIYTRCPLPDFCPLMDRKFAELADRIGAVSRRARHVRLLSVSFDPEHDTPEVLAKHARLQGAKPPLWTFAVATHPELAKAAPALGLTYGPTENEIVHNLSTAVIDPDGRLRRLDAGPSGKSWKPSDLVKTIYSCIPASG